MQRDCRTCKYTFRATCSKQGYQPIIDWEVPDCPLYKQSMFDILFCGGLVDKRVDWDKLGREDKLVGGCRRNKE